ncbi:MAG: tetratricopeptide repeat protein [Planctomycetes bacterium]|nr:tetratricopeptide repeat protein [Planctomycetota bacterium]
MRPLVVLIGILLFAGQASGQLDRDPRYLKKRAERLLAQFDYQGALDLLDRSAAKLPRDGEIRILRGETLFLMERWDEAAAAYEDGLALAPALRGRITNLPLALVRAGRLDEAAAAGRRLLDTAEDDHGRANARFIRGLIAWHRGRLAEARAELELAVKQEPRLAKAWYRLGLVLLHEDEAKAAAAAFEQVLELDRLHHAAAHNLALAALRLGDPARARAARELQARIIRARQELLDLRAGLEKKPKDPAILRRIADIHFEFGSYFEAAPIYAAVAAAEPEALEPRLRFMRCKFETREYHEARLQARVILERDPENAEARRILDAIVALVEGGEGPSSRPSSRPAEIKE